MTSTMEAVLLRTPGPIERGPLSLERVAIPEPGPGELLVKVAACGVCRSNLHMIEGDWVANGVPAKSPIVPGHEVVGRVEAVGPGAFGFTRGDRVGVQPLWSTCGHCRYCRTGREELCPEKQITGETLDGGYAEYMLAHAEHTYRVPETVSDADAAPLFCPGITAYGAVAKIRPAPGQTVAVFGIGGVGHMVLQLLRLHGADVVAVARGKRHQELATQLGAGRVIDPSQADAGEVLRRSGGVDAAILFAPSTALMRQAIAATRPGGTIVAGAFAEIGPFSFVEEKTIVGSLLGSRQQMNELLALAGRGLVKAVCEPFPLAQASEALTRLKRGEIEARAVLTVGR